jgi:hypothetical protein
MSTGLCKNSVYCCNRLYPPSPWQAEGSFVNCLDQILSITYWPPTYCLLTLVKENLYILDTSSQSRAGSNFYGTEIEIWADFGPVDSTEKKFGADYEQLLREVFSCFHRQKTKFKFFKIHCIVVSAKYSPSIVSCSTGDTSLRDFYIMTLLPVPPTYLPCLINVICERPLKRSMMATISRNIWSRPILLFLVVALVTYLPICLP